MKKINKVLIALSLVFISWGVKAHNPDLSSTLLVEQSENNWVLQVRAALTAFEYEIHQHYGADAYTTPEAFQELVIRHLQNNLSILFNETTAVLLKNGMVKLGHETSVTFEVAGTPETIQSLMVRNSSFSDIPRNQSALIVLKKGFAKDQFTIDNTNEHRVELKAGDAKFVLAKLTEEKTPYSVLIFAGAFLVLFIVYFTFKKRKSIAGKKHNSFIGYAHV